MALGDLTTMINRLSYERNVTIGASTSPTETETVAWLNDGAMIIASLLCPQMLPEHKSTPGRIDKIQELIESEEEVNSVSGAVVTAGSATLPTTSEVILYFKTIEFSVGAAAYKPAKLVTLKEVLDDYQRSSYGATSANPICAFGDGVMRYAPKAGTSPIDRVLYTFIEEPTAMVKTTTEDFPYSRDMMIPCIHYARYMMWEQGERNRDQAQRAFQVFTSIMSQLTGFSQKMIESAVS